MLWFYLVLVADCVEQLAGAEGLHALHALLSVCGVWSGGGVAQVGIPGKRKGCVQIHRLKP